MRYAGITLLIGALAVAGEWEDEAGALMLSSDEAQVFAGVELCVAHDSERAARLLCAVLEQPLRELAGLRADYARAVERGDAPVGLGYTEEERERRGPRLPGPKDGGTSARLALEINALFARSRAVAGGLARLRSAEARAWLREEGLAERSAEVRAEVACALGELGDREATEALTRALDDRSTAVRVHALDALARLGAKEAAEAIAGCLEDRRWQVRSAAIAALQELAARAQVPALVERLHVESGRLDQELEDALLALTGEALGADPALWEDWLAVHAPSLTDGSYRPPANGGETVPRAFGTFFGIPVVSENVLLVIDFSKSMQRALTRTDPLATGEQERLVPGETRIAEAREQAIRLIDALPKSARFGVVLYHWGVELCEGTMLKANDRNKERVKSALLEASLGLGTNIHDALDLALDITASDDFEKNAKAPIDTIYFLSDGAPTSGRYAKQEDILASFVYRNRARKLLLHTVLIRDAADAGPRAARFMRQLAESTGGTFVDVGKTGPDEEPADAAPVAELIAQHDSDGDGRISRDEAPPRLRQRFDRADTNGDGAIDAAEAERFQRRRR